MPLTGHCLCGHTTFTIDVNQPDAVGYDHCDACQRQTGSAFSLVAIVPREKLTIKGPIKAFKAKGDSGNDVTRIFCSDCGSPIAHQPDAAPEISAIKAGCFTKEIKQGLKPTLEIYCQDKLAFLTQKLEKPFDGMPK
ncbi:hypothetical protein CROQUDRAFT_652186 [Cronartium quercuum f. sp. fusiforme G11]|uniref:CENP-V/GFA domain-containing protein n=1 Tax=Cronartium quercuum f. sp. fusiforme G11 TaxID=708437 RepID=A0A9P6NUT0_9BASI|nr:hypothetical protein CROQUDRAFT_652186 [Cronartium quercuum f. sp. fusiforme G11]